MEKLRPDKVTKNQRQVEDLNPVAKTSLAPFLGFSGDEF